MTSSRLGPARPVALLVALAVAAVLLWTSTGGLVLTADASSSPAPSARGRITQIVTEGEVLDLVFTADGLRAGETLDVDSITVLVGEDTVPAQARPLVTEEEVARHAILAIDVSGSMAGVPIAAAKDAARRFVAEVPDEVAIGLVSFGGSVRRSLAPTLDRAAMRREIEQLQAGGRGTLLYDGIIQAIAEAREGDVRSVLLLSDGDDAGSSASLTEAVNAVKASNTPLDVIALGDFGRFIRPLTALTDASTSGRILLAPAPSDLSALFANAASSIANQVAVSATLPAGVAAGTVNVEVSALVGSVRLHDSAAVAVRQQSRPAAPPIVVDSPALVVGPFGYAVGILAVFAALAVATVVVGNVAAQAGGSTNRTLRGMSMYTLSGQSARLRPQPESTALGDGTVTRSAVGFADRVVASRGLDVMLAKQLELAGVPLRPGEWLILHASTASGLGVLCVLLSGGSLLIGIIGIAIGFAGPPLYLNLRAERRRTAFATQLPDTLQLLAGSLSAGYSLAQAVDTVVREGQEPLASEFGRALSATRLGVPVEDALEATAARMDSTDFAWVVMAIRIQRDVGGNLSELLRTVAETLRERDFLKRQVTAMSAEGRLSALILLALPPVFALILGITRPDYVGVLFRTPVGLGMILVAILSLALGFIWLRQIVDVKP